ncbi:MAG: hypothetical protein K0R69_1708 [Clostridia bacterium]|nr:hypothetical protein [Clostridia bacterium]
MECRDHCGACCIAPSISSPIPGMPQGKKAGERCVQLDSNNRCKIFQSQDRPKVCGSLQPSKEMCKNSTEEALDYLKRLQQETEPD